MRITPHSINNHFAGRLVIETDQFNSSEQETLNRLQQQVSVSIRDDFKEDTTFTISKVPAESPNHAGDVEVKAEFSNGLVKAALFETCETLSKGLAALLEQAKVFDEKMRLSLRPAMDWSQLARYLEASSHSTT